MKSSIKIEKNIPFISGKHRVNYPFTNMKVGDSFFIPAEKGKEYITTTRILSASRVFRRKDGYENFRFTTRKVEGGIRCWRFE